MKRLDYLNQAFCAFWADPPFAQYKKLFNEHPSRVQGVREVWKTRAFLHGRFASSTRKRTSSLPDIHAKSQYKMRQICQLFH